MQVLSRNAGREQGHAGAALSQWLVRAQLPAITNPVRTAHAQPGANVDPSGAYIAIISTVVHCTTVHFIVVINRLEPESPTTSVEVILREDNSMSSKLCHDASMLLLQICLWYLLQVQASAACWTTSCCFPPLCAAALQYGSWIACSQRCDNTSA